MTTLKPARLVGAGLALLLALMAAPLGEARRGSSFGRSSLSGSGAAQMQLEVVPARVSRVAVRPGAAGREAWALGTSSARAPGYAQGTAGQVVFLKYTPSTGWVLAGPPIDRSGKVFNPALGSFALSANGEGWAVGDGGVIVHKAAGSDRWVESPQSRDVTQQTLTVVSVAPDGGGYAVGTGPTILRLVGSAWFPDQPSADMLAQTSELQSVAAVSRDEAWAVATGQVTGADATNVLIYRRTASGWVTLKTGQAIFDGPPAKSPDGALNRGAEVGAVAADARGAWIGGRMHPRSVAFPEGDPNPGDASRAFVLRYEAASGRFTSYCPDLYGERAGAVDLTRMCDEPFPTAPFHVASLSIVPGGDVFAGGLGLFRFSRDGWYREPNTNGYLISIAMATNSEGFVASPGRSLGAGGLIRSSSSTIGHWTASPRRSALARWAQPQSQLLESVAVAPDGSGRAIAVGAEGNAIIFSGSAWDSINREVTRDLHGVGWPSGGDPWAVGSFGTLLRLRDAERWEFHESPTTAALFSVAFRSKDEGVAVGLGGTILVYRNGTWRDDSPKDVPHDLYSVVATPQGYVAVGKDGAVVEGLPGAWRARREARSLLLRPDAPQAPTLYAAARFGDRIVMGGQDASLLVREPGGALRVFPAPLEGTVLSLASDGVALYASVSPNTQKFRGEAPAAQRGTVLRYAGGRWTDIGLDRRVTLLRDRVDPSRFEDPIYQLAVEGTARGWGAGGSPAALKDQTEGHFRSLPTGAIYRLAYGGDPTPPASDAPLDAPKPGVPFAAFGESWCGTGLCSSAVGTGTMADEVALQIREEVNAASLQPGGPRFVLYTGNMRRVGIPEELEQFRNYLRGFRIPVFAAPGTFDRFTGFDGGQQTSASGSNDYWKAVFAQELQPWGQGARHPNFEPVAGTGVDPLPDQARNHYAFDYVEGGKRMLRVAVLDSSTRSYGTLQEQNPQEDQGAWLKAVLTEAADVLRIPSIVVMNQPTVLPSDQQVPNWINNQQDFEGTVLAARVSAVITGGLRVNARDTIKGVVPMFVVGGGGAPLGRDLQIQGAGPIEPPTKLPTDGYYHAWHLFRLDPDDRPLPLIAQARISGQAFPVVETLSMHSSRGYRIEAGNTTDLSALARMITGGFSDPEQAKAAYLAHGTSMVRCDHKGQGNGVCTSGAAVMPRFRFYSEDPSMADLVERDRLRPSEPFRVGKEIVADRDGEAGLLCVFGKLGRVGINAVAGLHRARIEIEVVPGKGPCIESEVKGRRIVIPPVPPQPREPVIEEEFFRPTRPRQEVAAVFPPPPAPVVAPAPPGAPGVGKKEEHEVEFETEAHDDGSHAFTALPRSARATDMTRAAWPILGATALFAFAAAAAAAAVRERRRPSDDPARQRWSG